MAYDSTTKQISRDYRFETADDAEPGDSITQQQMDVAFDDVVTDVNLMAANLFEGIDAFNAVFLGAHVANPTVDGDGNPVVSGALYVNTTVPELRFYNGTSWVPAAQSSVVIDNFIGDGSRTIFELGIPPRSEKTLFVHIDGIYQNKDGFSISANSIVFSEAPPNGSIIETMLFSTTSIGQTSAELVSNASGGTVQDFIDRQSFTSFAQFIADTRTFTAGTILTIPSIGAVYSAVDGVDTGNLSGLGTRTDGKGTNAGGQEFDVLASSDGAIHSQAFGAVGPGVETSAMTAALLAAAGKAFVIDRPPLGSFISDRLIPEADTTITLVSGTVFNVLGGGSRGFQIQQENVHIFGYGASVIADGTQDSHAIYFNSGGTNVARNCTLHGLTVSGSGNSGDDVIYVGGSPTTGVISENIRLYDVVAVGNAFTRNGLSLVAVDGFYAQNCKFSNGGGVASPGAAVDIEANNWMADGSSPCKNWHFKGCDFHDSDNAGFIAIYGSDGVVEDCLSYGNGNSGYACNAGGRNFEDDNYRLGDRLAVSAVSTADGWLTVSTGTPGLDLLTTDLGVFPGMTVNRQVAVGASWPTEIQSTVRWVIAEIDETETKIRLASGYIYNKQVSLSGGSYPGLTTDPTTSDLHLLVYGREGNLSNIKFIRCKGYDNLQSGIAKPDYDIGLCGTVTLEDCESVVPNILNAQAINFAYSYKVKIKGGKFAPAVFGSSTKGISGTICGPFEISGAEVTGFGNIGISAQGMTHSLIKDSVVIDCGLVSAGSSNYPVYVQNADGGKLDNVHVINHDAHRTHLGSGLRVASTSSNLVVADCSGTSNPLDTGVNISGSGTVIRNVRNNGARVSELDGATTANLALASNVINTAGKYAGKIVRDTTPAPDRLVMATGSTPTSIWLALDGSATVTPV